MNILIEWILKARGRTLRQDRVRKEMMKRKRIMKWGGKKKQKTKGHHTQENNSMAFESYKEMFWTLV